MTLYEELKQAGCTMRNRESDLYVLVSSTANEIIKRFNKEHPYCLISAFKSQADGLSYYEVTFGYDPFWENKK